MRSSAGLRLIVCATLCISHLSAWAADQPWHRATLAGVGSVHVLVEDLSHDLKSAGLSITTLQTDAELRLHSAGIRVATEEFLTAPGSPYLYVTVIGLRDTDIAGRQLGFSAAVRVEFVQIVQLQRNPSVRFAAPTWSVAHIVGGPSPEIVRRSLRDLVDRFANAYLSVNPK